MKEKVIKISEWKEKKKPIPFEWTHPITGSRANDKRVIVHNEIYSDPRGWFN